MIINSAVKLLDEANKKYEDSHFEEYLDTQTIVNVDIEKRMKEDPS